MPLAPAPTSSSSQPARRRNFIGAGRLRGAQPGMVRRRHPRHRHERHGQCAGRRVPARQRLFLLARRVHLRRHQRVQRRLAGRHHLCRSRNAAFTASGPASAQVVFGQAPNPNSAISWAARSMPITSRSDAGAIRLQAMSRWSPRGSSTAARSPPTGQTALVAAEAATINFSPDGLFDIQVTVGSDQHERSRGSRRHHRADTDRRQRTSSASIWWRFRRTTR